MHCSMYLKFEMNFKHVTHDVYKRSRSRGQRPRSQRDRVWAVKRYKTGTDKLTEFKFG